MEEQARVLPRGRRRGRGGGLVVVVLGAEATLRAKGPQQSGGRRRRLPRAHGLRRRRRRLLRPQVHDEEGHDTAAAAAAEHGVRAVEGRLQSGEEQPAERLATAAAAAAVLVRRRLEVGGAPVQPAEGVPDQGSRIGGGGGTGAVAQPTAQVSLEPFCLKNRSIVSLILCCKFVLGALKHERRNEPTRNRSSQRSLAKPTRSLTHKILLPHRHIHKKAANLIKGFVVLSPTPSLSITNLSVLITDHFNVKTVQFRAIR